MAKRKKIELSARERRRLRIKQILFISVGVIIILSLVISSLINI